jgi:hypothetical protein
MMPDMGTHSRLGKLGALAADNPALIGVAGIGFAVSFQTISRLAVTHHLPGWPVLYPLGIDVGILALIIESRKAIDARRSDLVPRVLAWVLAALTIYVNAHGAPAHDWLGRAMHVVMPALWIVFLELTRWRKLAKRRSGDKREGIPLARWIAAPVSSLVMHRRMVLRDIRSYSLAVELEDARRFVRDITVAHFGRSWRKEIPRVLIARIRSGRLGDDVTRSVAGTVSAGVTGGWESTAREMVRTAITEGDRLTADVKRERRQIDRQDEQQNDAPKTRQTAGQKPVSETVRKHVKVERLLTVTPALSVREVARQAGVSESTVSRVKREPRHGLSAVR